MKNDDPHICITLIQVVDMFPGMLSNLAQLTLERFESQTLHAPREHAVSGMCVATLLVTFTKKQKPP